MQKNKNVRTTSLKSIAAVLRARGKIQGHNNRNNDKERTKNSLHYFLF